MATIENSILHIKLVVYWSTIYKAMPVLSYTIDQEVIDKRNLWKTLKRLKDTLNMVELITDEPTSNKKMQGKPIKLISTDATIAQKKPSV